MRRSTSTKHNPIINQPLLSLGAEHPESAGSEIEQTQSTRIFSHSQKYRRFWEYLILVVSISILIEVSFYGIFIKDMNFFYYIIFILFDFIYLADIYVYLHTSYFSHGIIINDLSRIRDHIGRYRIAAHIVGAIPLSWIGVLLKNPIVYIGLSLPRLFRLQRGLDASYTISQTLIYSWNWSQLFQSILLEILCVHFFACIFYLSAALEGKYHSWVSMHGWDYLTPPQQYVVSIYFVMTTILTIGFGDLTPKISQERIIVIFIQLIGVMINGYIISMMVSSLYDPIGSNFLNSYRGFVDFMNFKEIPKNLVNEIIHFFQERWNQTRGADDLKEVLKFVPETVRDHLKLDMTRQCLSQVSMMQVANEKLLIGFSNAMNITTFAPGEIIFKEGEIYPELYLLKSGNIRLDSSENQTMVINNDNRICLGELELFLDIPRKMTASALTFVEVWIIERNNLLASFAHSRELRQELLRVCLLIFPTNYKDIKRTIYKSIQLRSRTYLSQQAQTPQPVRTHNNVDNDNDIEFLNPPTD